MNLTSLNTITVIVPDNRIADLLCEALEGGSSYWMRFGRIKLGDRLAKPWGENKRCPNYIEAPFFGTLEIELLEDGSDDAAERPVGMKIELNRAKLRAGLTAMAAEAPHEFGAMLTENDDANTGDAFLQCCLFGKVIFG